LGDHIRKRRLDLGLLQREVAERIGVDATAIYNWEGNKASPQIHYLPRIIRFLGYNPLPVYESLPDKLLTARRSLGFTQKTFAERLGVDPGTLRSWESGKRLPSKKLSRIIAGFLRSPEPELD
jgi:transcriptional regulator with XRE-family HTH domain